MRRRFIVLLLGIVNLCGACSWRDEMANGPALDIEAPIATEQGIKVDDELGSVPEFDAEKYRIMFLFTGRESFDSITASLLSGLTSGINEHNSSKSGGEFRLELVEFELDETDPEGLADLERTVFKTKPAIVLAAIPLTGELAEIYGSWDCPVLSFGLGDVSESRVPWPENYFSLVPTQDQQAAFVISEIWRSWRELAPSPGVTQASLGILHSRAEALSVEDGIFRYLQRSGFTVEAEGISPGGRNQSATNFLLDARFHEAAVIYIEGEPALTGTVITDAANLAISDFFVFSGSIWSVDQVITTLLMELEPAPDLIIPLPVAWWAEEGHPAILAVEEMGGEWKGEDGKKDLGYLMGLVGLDIARESISSAYIASGGERLIGGDVLAAVESLADYSVLEGLMIIDFSDGNHAGDWLCLWRLTPTGEWVPIGDGGEVPGLD